MKMIYLLLVSFMIIFCSLPRKNINRTQFNFDNAEIAQANVSFPHNEAEKIGFQEANLELLGCSSQHRQFVKYSYDNSEKKIIANNPKGLYAYVGDAGCYVKLRTITLDGVRYINRNDGREFKNAVLQFEADNGNSNQAIVSVKVIETLEGNTIENEEIRLNYHIVIHHREEALTTVVDQSKHLRIEEKIIGNDLMYELNYDLKTENPCLIDESYISTSRVNIEKVKLGEDCQIENISIHNLSFQGAEYTKLIIEDNTHQYSYFSLENNVISVEKEIDINSDKLILTFRWNPTKEIEIEINTKTAVRTLSEINRIKVSNQESSEKIYEFQSNTPDQPGFTTQFKSIEKFPVGKALPITMSENAIFSILFSKHPEVIVSQENRSQESRIIVFIYDKYNYSIEYDSKNENIKSNFLLHDTKPGKFNLERIDEKNKDNHKIELSYSDYLEGKIEAFKGFFKCQNNQKDIAFYFNNDETKLVIDENPKIMKGCKLSHIEELRLYYDGEGDHTDKKMTYKIDINKKFLTLEEQTNDSFPSINLSYRLKYYNEKGDEVLTANEGQKRSNAENQFNLKDIEKIEFTIDTVHAKFPPIGKTANEVSEKFSSPFKKANKIIISHKEFNKKYVDDKPDFKFLQRIRDVKTLELKNYLFPSNVHKYPYATNFMYHFWKLDDNFENIIITDTVMPLRFYEELANDRKLQITYIPPPEDFDRDELEGLSDEKDKRNFCYFHGYYYKEKFMIINRSREGCVTSNMKKVIFPFNIGTTNRVVYVNENECKLIPGFEYSKGSSILDSNYCLPDCQAFKSKKLCEGLYGENSYPFKCKWQEGDDHGQCSFSDSDCNGLAENICKRYSDCKWVNKECSLKFISAL